MATQGFERMQDNVSTGSDSLPQESHATGRGVPGSLRAQLDTLIHSHKFMVAVIVLVVLDCLMVLAELLFDLEVVKLGEDLHYVPHIFHYCSLAILSIFLVEVAMRIYVLRLEFLQHKLELFDAFVVVVSWILDIVFRNNEDAASGVGLLILLRLWRITRIVNNIVLSAQKQADQKVEKERHLRLACEGKLDSFSKYCTAIESRVSQLEDLLSSKDIDFSFVPEVNVEKPDIKVVEPMQKSNAKADVDNAVVELNDIACEIGQMSGGSSTT